MVSGLHSPEAIEALSEVSASGDSGGLADDMHLPFPTRPGWCFCWSAGAGTGVLVGERHFFFRTADEP